MKRITLTILLLASTLFSNAQRTAFAPARGHYKQLKQLSTKPSGENLDVDKQKFPFDAATAERVDYRKLGDV